MKAGIKNVFKGQLFTSLIYLALGVCLVVFPGQSVNIICKIVFGVVLMLAGLYHIWVYLSEEESSTVFNLFTGAILLVLGVFFFQNPQIVAMILPSLLAALLLVDSIWTLRTGLWLKKYGRDEWKFFVIVSLIFVTLGIVLFINPFSNMNHTIIFSGWSFIADAVLDFVSMILAVRGNRAIEKNEASSEKIDVSKMKKKERKSIASYFRRKDAEIIVANDSDAKAANSDADANVHSTVENNSDISKSDTENKGVEKKKFGTFLIGKMKKNVKNSQKESEKVLDVSDLEEESRQEVSESRDDSDSVQKVFELKEEPDRVQEVFELKEEPDRVQEVFELKEEPDRVQEVFELKEESDRVQEVFELKEEKDVLQDLFKEANEESSKLREMFTCEEEKNHLHDLLKLDEDVLEEWKD